jgi:hypothetical protein
MRFLRSGWVYQPPVQSTLCLISTLRREKRKAEKEVEMSKVETSEMEMRVELGVFASKSMTLPQSHDGEECCLLSCTLLL